MLYTKREQDYLDLEEQEDGTYALKEPRTK